MFILEEKFKKYYGEDYFPYYVGTLAAMMTYNYNDLLCNVISLKENEFLAKVVRSIVPLPNIKYSLISDAKNKLIYTIRTIGYYPFKITCFDINAETALKHKKVFAYNNYELFDENKKLIFFDKKPTLVLDLKDKEFNIDYDFHYIDMIKMEKIENSNLFEIAGIFKDKLNTFKKESLLAYKLYSSLILSINEFIHLFAKIYLAEKECFSGNWDDEIDYKELSCKILDYSYEFFNKFKAYYEEIEKNFYISYIPKIDEKIIKTAKNMLIFEENPTVRELYRKTNTSAAYTKKVLKKYGFKIDNNRFYSL